MDTLPYAPLFGTLALALLWSALFTAVDAARRALYFLEPMLFEPGLGKSLGERDRLASDEPNAKLTSPT